MPPVILGATIFVPFALVFAFRPKLENRFVLSMGEFKQTFRQFKFDLTLYLLAGCSVAVYNYFINRFPLSSGISIIFGSFVLGFFIALDMALFRERVLIQNAQKKSSLALLPPKELYPMSRRFSMVAVATAFFVIVIMALVISRDFAWLNTMGTDTSMITAARQSVMKEIIYITVGLLILVINLIISYSKNLKLLFQNETGVLEKVSKGDLSSLVPVVTQDEFGQIAGHTNSMIHGLRHRLELLTSIKLAEEVQRNLLPSHPPKVKSVDLAGDSIYCKETGGDYYDYFSLSKNRLGIVVADAAGHGLGSAMHMTSARAFLQAAMDRYVDPAQIISDVNRYLTRDSRNTGRFMTLFFLEIDLIQRQLHWIRAGHDPALLYDPNSGQVEILDGSGVVLGVSEEVIYTTRHSENWAPGSVLVIGTDGIWETRNGKGEMFGKERLIQTIKAGSDQKENAKQLLDRILSQVTHWRNDQDQEDDITLVTAILR